jgi:hypothetical protein
MTRDRDIERVLERWFTEGPTQMPDHLFDVVGDRIDRIPQRRLARLVTRFAAMNLNARLAAAAAIIIAVAGIGALALNRSQGVGVNPTPTPALTSSPSATVPSANPSATVSLPATLASTWQGYTIRPIPGLTPTPDRAALKLTTSDLQYVYYSPDDPAFLSAASLGSPNILSFTLTRDGWGCHVGDLGTYAFTLNGSARALSLQVVADPCAARSVALAGDWVRESCADPNESCLGDLDAGVHASVAFTPFVPPSQWHYDQARFTYTVPDGWANTSDGPSGYELQTRGGTANEAIYLFSDVVPHSQAASCPETAAPGVGRTASAISNWLRALPGLVTTKPVAVTVGGLSGYQLDLSVAPGWTHTCPYSNGQSLVSTFTDTDPATGGFDWNDGGSAHARYVLLDLGDGRTLLVSVEADSKAAWDGLLTRAMPVIATFQFNR